MLGTKVNSKKGTHATNAIYNFSVRDDYTDTGV